MKRKPFLVAALASMVLSACAGPAAATPAPSPTPFIPFPAHDTPLSSTSGTEKEMWSAYEVGSVPGTGVTALIPPTPHVVDATKGAVPADVAQAWGDGFMRDAAYRKWALQHGEATFYKHIDGDSSASANLQQGNTETIPPCALWPTALTLTQIPVGPSGSIIANDQFEFIATYQPPPGGTCDVEWRFPDSHTQQDFTFDATLNVAAQGWFHIDPVLGNLWISDSRSECLYGECPSGLTDDNTPPPPFPQTDIELVNGTPEQQAVWQGYAVKVIPHAGVVYNIPKPGKVTNNTHGVLSSAQAQEWAQAVNQAGAWQRFAYEHIQSDFEAHLADSSQWVQGLSTDGSNGGVPAVPDCAVYPTAVTIAIISDDDRNGLSQATHLDQFKLDLYYKSKCTVSVQFPNGTTDSVTMPTHLTDIGSIRDDPFLGEIWWPDSVQNADGVSFGGL